MKTNFNPDIQYRCTIIVEKSQKDLNILFPAYANFVAKFSLLKKVFFVKDLKDDL